MNARLEQFATPLCQRVYDSVCKKRGSGDGGGRGEGCVFAGEALHSEVGKALRLQLRLALKVNPHLDVWDTHARGMKSEFR